MSLRARLVASIVTLIAATVVLLSVIFLRTTLQTSFGDARRIADENAQQVESFLLPRAQAAVQRMQPAPATLDEVADAYVRAVAEDEALDDLLANLVASSAVLIEALITGPDGAVLAASLNSRSGERFAPLPSLEQFEDKNLMVRLAETLASNQDYDVSRELGVGDRQLFTIHMVVSSLLMREHYLEPLEPLGIASVVALLVSVFAAVVVSRLAVRPFEKIGEQIDRITRGEQDDDAGDRLSPTKELAVVESKLSLLGQQFRGARADTEELRGSIDQLLDRLQEAVLLFGPDDKLVMAGGAAERLIGAGRWELMGKKLQEVFPDSSQLGALVQSAVGLRIQTKDRPVRLDGRGADAPRNLLASVDLIEDFVTHGRLGTLVTLREADPRKQIELQLDLSTRMAAISRLTSGAAHEIKNPLNSIALHLEVLRQKLSHDATGADEIEVISREIQRMDRVVKSFLDFTRPVELKVEEFDLGRLVTELADLVRLDAEAQGIQVICESAEGVVVRGDRDLLKQALLNVVVNGLQASSAGGSLELRLEGTDDGWLVRIKDHGAGIPEDVRPQIFQLYFSTKGGKGSGIGLAMTFQIVQLHGGTIDVVSEVGQGTEFRILMPTARVIGAARNRRRDDVIAPPEFS
jgi:signal transduction histidine kinase